MTVTHVWAPVQWRQNPKNKIFLIDEGEEAIETRLIDVTPAGFHGLLALRDHRVFLFTATLTDYYKACWLEAFQAPGSAVRYFTSQNELRYGQKLAQDVYVSVRRNKEETLEAFLEKIEEKMQDRPVLVFIAQDNEDALNKLEERMGPHSERIPFNKIEKEVGADQVQERAPTMSNGVFFMKAGLGRGVDFKFAKTAFVAILNYDNHYRSSYLVQMVGRSNRDQGIQEGHVFCNDTVVVTPEPGFAYLQDKEKKLTDDIGPDIARALARTWHLHNDDNKEAVATLFKNNKWQMKKQKFEGSNLSEALKAALGAEIYTD